MLAMTYVVQIGAVLVALSSITLIAWGISIGDYKWVPIQAFLFGINVALFFVQFPIRANLH